MKVIKLTIYQNTWYRWTNSLMPAGTQLTRWINQAMNEKLDRDAPGTIGLLPPATAEPAETKTIDPYAILADMKKQERGPDTGPYVIRYQWDEDGTHSTFYMVALANQKRKIKKGEPVIGLEAEMALLFKGSPQELSEEDKRAIMAEHHGKLAEKAAEVERAKKNALYSNTLTVAELEARAEADGKPVEVHTAEYLALCKPAAKPIDEFWGE